MQATGDKRDAIRNAIQPRFGLYLNSRRKPLMTAELQANQFHKNKVSAHMFRKGGDLVTSEKSVEMGRSKNGQLLNKPVSGFVPSP